VLRRFINLTLSQIKTRMTWVGRKANEKWGRSICRNSSKGTGYLDDTEMNPDEIDWEVV
jgi:hypothetical protein